MQKRRGTTVRHKQKDQTRTYLQVGEMLSRINGHGVKAGGCLSIMEWKLEVLEGPE